MERYDIIIIGAGTAGLSAAIYGTRAGKSVLVLEGKNYGGQIVNTPSVENYPGIKNVSGYEFATSLYEQAKEAGAKIQYERVLSVTKGMETAGFLVQAGEQYYATTVIIATGAKNRPLGLNNEEALIGAGVSYCATCDGAFFKKQTVAVNGGGNTALEDAMFLSNYCEHVYLVHRRDAFRGDEHTVKALQARENVTFLMNKQIIALTGTDHLEGIVLEDVHTKEKAEVDVAGLFIAIGQMPDNEAFQSLVHIDDRGYIVAGENCETDTPGIYTAGDCRTKKVRQLTTAAADGAVAALAACEYMNNKE